jgi:hypothetical protein
VEQRKALKRIRLLEEEAKVRWRAAGYLSRSVNQQ